MMTDAAATARSVSRRRSSSRRRSDVVLWTIAGFKLFKGLLLLAVAIGALTLLNEDVAAWAEHWIAVLRVDPHNHFIHALLVKLTRVDNHRLEAISAGTFFYAALLLTEGVGLFLRKRWAEYFTIFVTASLVPLEIYELVKKLSLMRLGVLVINIAVVVYLVLRVRWERSHTD
ncbi:MAG TPA: DUF2127 domain-containing protein [Pyrinomonadaceae bacterium]|jgi:uncharacterized membrane protein (DUF2068 family)